MTNQSRPVWQGNPMASQEKQHNKSREVLLSRRTPTADHATLSSVCTCHDGAVSLSVISDTRAADVMPPGGLAFAGKKFHEGRRSFDGRGNGREFVLGTTHSGGYYHDVVVHALRNCGYRMIDTARRYGVERELGIAWKESGVPRPFLFLCSKLWPTDFGPGTKRAFELSCAKLQTNYLDLYMTHFPVVPDYLGNARAIREDTWRQLELLYDEGRIRAIGVSNYMEDDLSELLEYCSVPPHVNQCEFHPWYNPVELRSFCEESGILYT
ncbi:glyoxal reductase domain protein, partial [Ancylostoma duodenale]